MLISSFTNKPINHINKGVNILNAKQTMPASQGLLPQNNTYNKYSAENVKANFLPSFQGYKKVGTAHIYDRQTGDTVAADIKKDKIGDFISIKMNIGKEEIGFIDIDCAAVFPEEKYVLAEPTNTIPRVLHLRSIAGDKYAGIGTNLIKTAIQESYNNGGYGNLWLRTEKGYERYLSPYRSDENPIPFYYKVGFESPDKNSDSYIKACIQKKQYHKLPNSELLLLTPEARDNWLKELVKNPIIKFRKTPQII